MAVRYIADVFRNDYGHIGEVFLGPGGGVLGIQLGDNLSLIRIARDGGHQVRVSFRFLLQRLTLHDEPADRFIDAFLKPPLYSTTYEAGFGTLYTAVYWPRYGRAEYRWPGEVWSHKVGEMEEGERLVVYPNEASNEHQVWGM